MAHVLSQDAKLYRNTGTFATPTWTEIDNVQDLTLELTKGETEVSTRAGGGWAEFVDGLKNATINWSMLWDTADTNFTAIRTAFTGNTTEEFLVLSGSTGTTGNQGLRATCMISGFTRNETLGEALTVDVSVRPVKNADSAPQWYTS